MISTHGFLKLTKDRKLGIDDTRAGVDEGIVCVISPRLTTIIITSELFELYRYFDIIPQHFIDRISVNLDLGIPLHCTLKTHSIGCMIICAIFTVGVGNHSSRFSYVFDERAKHEVLRVHLTIFVSKSDENYISHVIINSDGYYIMPQMEDGMCYRLTSTDSCHDIRKMLLNHETHRLTRYQDPVTPIKPSVVYSDIVICTRKIDLGDPRVY